MGITRKVATLVATTLTFGSLAGGARAATIINGGLNLLAEDAGTTVTVSGGGSYNGWVNNGSADIEFVDVQAGIGPADEGAGFIDLNGVSGPGRLSQTVSSILGQQYRIDFALSGNSGMGDRLGDKPMSVLWNGSTINSFTHVHLATDTNANIRWETQSVFVTGTGSDTLTFLSTGGTSDAGALIDDIEISAVPEPSSTFLLGLGAFAYLTRRRRNRLANIE